MKNPEFITVPKNRRGIARGLCAKYRKPPKAMQGHIVTDLTLGLSAERLAGYRGRPVATVSDREAFARYLWNMALAESLYPSLQALEVALRNTLHAALTQHFGCEDWYDVPGMLQHRNEQEALVRAKASLAEIGRPLEPSRVVAELSFGFWTSLLNQRYEQRLWPSLLKPAFPFLPKGQRTRKTLSTRLDKVRRLRNRVFHHEPIWHWRDLGQKHSDIHEAIGWIRPMVRDLVRTVDRFPAVHAGGAQAYEAHLAPFC